ncbi:MAG TPA: hypothetical protein VJS42_16440, partial [Steroidobacteraceae bacterium]|nr:hypothetical protein [Steroidobacteraceae bacterium]
RALKADAITRSEQNKGNETIGSWYRQYFGIGSCKQPSFERSRRGRLISASIYNSAVPFPFPLAAKNDAD